MKGRGGGVNGDKRSKIKSRFYNEKKLQGFIGVLKYDGQGCLIKKFMRFEDGRQEGIRTLEGLHLTRVPGVLLQPLGHLSMKLGIVSQAELSLVLKSPFVYNPPSFCKEILCFTLSTLFQKSNFIFISKELLSHR